MTSYQIDVLIEVGNWENTGTTEVALQMYDANPTALDQQNVERAVQRLAEEGYVDLADFSLTEKGRQAVGIFNKLTA